MISCLNLILILKFPHLDSSHLILGRLFGGCGIIFRKSLTSNICSLNSKSKRFCALSINSGTFVTLLICVYLPTNYGSADSHDLFLETVGEQGFY